MKLRLLFALVTLTISSYAQTDSIARVRKPVLTYLLTVEKEYKLLKLEIPKFQSLEKENALLQENLNKSKQDSVNLAALVETKQASADGWKKTSEGIETYYKSQLRKEKVWKWVGIGIGVVGVAGGVKIAINRR